MAEILLDGTGAGYRAKVNAENQLSVIASTVPLQHFVAHVHREAFSIVVQQTPTGAGSCFAYIANSDTKHLNIWNTTVYCAAAEAIEIWTVTGTAVGTDYSPVNFTVGSGVRPQATCKVGNGITGLTKVGLLKRYRVEAGNQDQYEIHSAIIVPEDHAIAFYAVTGTAVTEVMLTLDFHDEI